MAEGKIVRQHHQLNGHELDQTLGDSGGWGSLAGWRTGKPVTLQSMRSPRVGHDLATTQQQQT